MKFGWESRKEKILNGLKIYPEKKLEGIRLMNELSDQILTNRQKVIRQKLRKGF